MPNSYSTFVSVWLDYFWPSPWLCPCPWLPTPSSSYFWPPSWATPLRLLPPFPSARPLPSLCNLPCPLPGWGFHLPGILWKKNKNPVFHKYCELIIWKVISTLQLNLLTELKTIFELKDFYGTSTNGLYVWNFEFCNNMIINCQLNRRNWACFSSNIRSICTVFNSIAMQFKDASGIFKYNKIKQCKLLNVTRFYINKINL